MAGTGTVVSLRWAGEEDREEDNWAEECHRGASAPFVRERGRASVARRESRRLAGPSDAKGRSGADRVLARRRFFWRRVFVVLVIAGFGALAWSATARLIAVASGQLSNEAPCAPDLAGRQPQMVALAAAESPSPSAKDGGAKLEFSGTNRDQCSQVYVATPGDTIWAIATRFSGGADPRPLAANLEAEIGGGTLQPGQRLAVP